MAIFNSYVKLPEGILHGGLQTNIELPRWSRNNIQDSRALENEIGWFEAQRQQNYSISMGFSGIFWLFYGDLYGFYNVLYGIFTDL